MADVSLLVSVGFWVVVAVPAVMAADLVQGEPDRGTRHEFTVDAAFAGRTLWNPASMAVVWDGGALLTLPARRPDAEWDPFRFVEEIEIMQCLGGKPERDCLRDPLDGTVTDDYDFSRLVVVCGKVLELGAKPYLKLGSVPAKFSRKKDGKTFFCMNIRPPADYGVWKRYVEAALRALVGRFGLDEVRRWRFAVMTECENELWFLDDSGDPEKTKAAYFKLHDTAVEAIATVLGPKMRIGIHPAAHAPGAWDACDMIRHVAETGGRLDFVAVSFYDASPGRDHGGWPWVETFGRLRDAASSCGLFIREWGVDEGRLFDGRTAGGDSAALAVRATGLSWQGAWDARAVKRMFDSDVRYFAAWGYLSGPDAWLSGLPSVSYHVAANAALFKGLRRVPVCKRAPSDGFETDAVAAWHDGRKSFHAMVYRFTYDLKANRSTDVSVKFRAQAFAGCALRVVLKRVGDDSNWFDDWERDRLAYGITDKDFKWSSDDLAPMGGRGLAKDGHREIFARELEPKYRAKARLVPEDRQAVADARGEITVTFPLKPHEVMFATVSVRRE